MTTSNIQTLHDLAETAVATYATLQSNASLARDLINPDTGAGFTETQAADFVDRYKLLSTQSNVALNGFSGSVFLDRQTGQKVLALRGTEFTVGEQVTPDLVVADILGIGVNGYANLQGLELYRYFKRLTTVGGQDVSYSDVELRTLYALKLGPAFGSVVFSTPLTALAGLDGFSAFKTGLLGDKGIDAGQEGASVIGPGERIDVTGHSLGGHLALLFARLFPSNVAEVVTLNAPTFFTHGDGFLSMLGFPISINGQITRIEADGDGVSELGNVDPGSAVRMRKRIFQAL